MNSAKVGRGRWYGSATVTITIVGAGLAADIVHERFSQCDCAARFIGQLALQQQLFRDGNDALEASAKIMIRAAANPRRTA